MAKIVTTNNTVFLKPGTYCPNDLKKLELTCTTITKITLCPKNNIVIIPHIKKDKQYDLDNDYCKKKKFKICIKLGHCPSIIIRPTSDVWDYIIVGLGSAGSILARKLTDDLKTRVLVLEAGINHQSDPIILDPNWIDNANKLIYDSTYSVTYPIEINPNIPLTPTITYSEGRLWGGSSAHNFLLAVRGTPAVYDEWAAISGNPMWSYNNMLPYMKAVETYTPTGTPIDTTQRGTNGPISVTQSAQAPTPNTSNPLLEAYNTVTHTPFVNDFNVATSTIGISSNQQFITPPFGGSTSRRSYANLEFLPVGTIIDANGNGLNGRKLKIISNVKVDKFNTVNGRAVSVDYINPYNADDVSTVLLRSTGQLILTAGAINTPCILMRSGVGPASLLNSLNIPVVVNSPQVGQNLQNQYGTPIIASVTNLPENSPLVFMDMYPTLPDDGVRRVQAINIIIGPNLLEILPIIVRPNSHGSVSIVSSNPLFAPNVDIGIFTDDPSGTNPTSDLALQIDFFNIAKTVVETAGGTVLFPSAFQYSTPGQLAAAAVDANHLTVQSHIVGTTRMGTNINNGVVDGYLNVFGLTNVKIGDIGIEPDSVDGNTCFSAYYIALVLSAILGVATPPAL